MKTHVLCVSGEDHDLRIPFMLALHNRGFRVSAAGTGDQTPFSRAGVPYFAYHFDRSINPLSDWAAIKALSKLFADVRPDIVHSFDTKPSLMAPFAARRAGSVPVVRTINGRAWLYSTRSPMALGLRPVYRMLQRLAAGSTAATVFEHREDQAFFERHGMIGDGGSLVIPGAGIDVEGFERSLAFGPSPTELRQALGLGGSEVVITVTRMTREKGIPALLEAAALVHEARPGVRFLLVGPREGEGLSAVSQAEIDQHAPYVIATGRRSDIPSLLRLADIFAFPTEYREGVPRALCEAALVGLPIVTTNMPGCCEVVRDGWNGFLVPPRAPRALAGKILELLRNRQAAREMGARAAEPVRALFSLEAIVTSVATLYTNVLSRSGRSPFPSIGAEAGAEYLGH
jgi:glycosyltransferase involved in cell wall biosynthesis